MEDFKLHSKLLNCQGYWQADLELFEYGRKRWGGLLSPESLAQLEMFGQTGSGGIYAIWQLGDGRRPVVYLCDEGLDTCLVSRNLQDFIELIAIGYYRFPIDSSLPPELETDQEGRELLAGFQSWAATTLQCKIPATGKSLTIHNSKDYPNFSEWLNHHWIAESRIRPLSFGERIGVWVAERLKNIVGSSRQQQNDG